MTKTETMEPSLSDVVEGAVEVLDEYGWVQHFLGSDDQGYCVLGAMQRWKFGGFVASPELNKFFIYLHEELAEYFEAYKPRDNSWISGDIPAFNDYHATSVIEVKDKLMEVAKDLRNKGK